MTEQRKHPDEYYIKEDTLKKLVVTDVHTNWDTVDKMVNSATPEHFPLHGLHLFDLTLAELESIRNGGGLMVDIGGEYTGVIYLKKEELE